MHNNGTNQFYVILEMNNEKIVALIDTGAERSLISWNKVFSRSLMFTPTNTLWTISSSIDYNYKMTVRIIIKDRLNNELEVKCDLMAAIDINYNADVLLGMNFLECFNSFIITGKTLALEWNRKMYIINRVNLNIDQIRYKLKYGENSVLPEPNCVSNEQSNDIPEDNSEDESIDMEMSDNESITSI